MTRAAREYRWRFTETTFNALVRDARRGELAAMLSALEPRRVFAALLDHADSRAWRRGSAFHAFREIFARSPRRQDEDVAPAPLPAPYDLLLVDWYALRPKRKPPKRKAPSACGAPGAKSFNQLRQRPFAVPPKKGQST
jgi:hypothetical protein